MAAGMQSAVDLNSINGIVPEVKSVTVPTIFLPTGNDMTDESEAPLGMGDGDTSPT